MNALPASRGRQRARSADSTTSVRWKQASAAILRSGTSKTPPSSSIAWDSTLCTHASGGEVFMTRSDSNRIVRAPRGPQISARSWLTEAPLRMIMNNLDPQVAERPQDLVVYGGIGRAARDWESFDRI